MFNRQKNKASTQLKQADHYAAYTIFITSVVLYFYLSRTFLLYLLDQDTTLTNLVIALIICWLISVGLMAHRLRFYLKHAPGYRSYLAAFFPAIIVPCVWALLEIFRFIEV